MSINPHVRTGNQLFDAIPVVDLEALAIDLDWVEIALHQVISEPGQIAEHAYFPVSGVFSAIALADINDQIEMGLIGREGFVGASIVLRAGHDPFRLIAQAPGHALRISTAKLLSACAMAEFQATLLRFVHVFMVQSASTLLAHSSYLVEERLARWILMTHDRLDTNSFPMTHEFMALMLAVRRAGVTEAIHKLESRHLIRTSRGQMLVLDREGLIAYANGCYGQAEREHRRLIIPTVRE